MTEEREFYAPTLDEAVARAAADLGVPSEELGFKVLDEGSTGFLGIGARDARIAVQLESVSVTDSAERSESPVSTPEAEPVPARAEDTGAAGVESAQSGGPSEEERPEAPADLLEEVSDLVSSVLTAMNFKAGLDVYDAGDFIAVDVSPENTALFIGQKGETIDALQYLLNVATHKEYTSVKKRAVLDAEGYRQRRIEALQGMAHRSARRAIRERRRIELPPMNPSERRIVHLYLQENDRVTTASEGTGDSRRVTVSPL